MKRNLLSCILIVILNTAFAQSNTRDISTIDTGDTVFFNLAQSVVVGGYVEFPVSFKSDDVINAIDFSLKYSNCFQLDTITKMAGYLTMTYNVTTDTTLFLSAYSLQTITNDTPLVKIRFHVLSGQLCSGDLNSISVYLNGEMCSFRITDPIGCSPGGPGCPLGISDYQNEISSLTIYPNPFINSFEAKFFAAASEKVLYSVSDLTGRIFIQENIKSIAGYNHIYPDMNDVAPGVYILSFKTENGAESVVRLIKH